MPFDGIVTRAVTEEWKEKIIPGKITKIHQPAKTELVITVRSKGENNTLLLSIHPAYARIHLTGDNYLNPKEPPMFCMLLRKHISGAIIESVEQHGLERIISLSIKTRNEIGDITYKKLIIELMGKHSNIMLVDGEKGHIIDSLKHVSMVQNRYRTILPGQEYKLPPSQNKLDALTIDSSDLVKKIDFNAGKLDKQIVQNLTGFSPLIAKELVYRAHLGSMESYQEKFSEIQAQIMANAYTPAIYMEPKEDFHVLDLAMFDHTAAKKYETVNIMLDQYFSHKAERDQVKQQAKDLFKFIKNEKDKNERKLKKHQKTIKKADSADKYQHLGELLTANMHLLKQGDTSISVIDYYDPEQKKLQIELNPNKTPSENAQSFFKTYQKLKTSKIMVENEISKTNAEIDYLEQLLQQLDMASMGDIEEIRDELRDEGYLKKQRQRKKVKKNSKPLPEQYLSTDGTLILVGKNNKQNEYVTMHLAHRDDVWLHTKDIPGSHVIIRDRNPSEETLLEAAAIAAYYSKSQASSSVPVDYTTIRHVKKPNGAKPGFVTYDNQKTIFVTPKREIADKLRKK